MVSFAHRRKHFPDSRASFHMTKCFPDPISVGWLQLGLVGNGPSIKNYGWMLTFKEAFGHHGMRSSIIRLENAGLYIIHSYVARRVNG